MCTYEECKKCRTRIAVEIHRQILMHEKELPDEIVSLLKSIYVALRFDE